MSFTPFTLNLTADQQEILSDLGIDPAAMYIVNNDDVPTTAPVTGYTNGYCVAFFSNDTAMESHYPKFVEDLFGPKYTNCLAKSRGVYIYGGPVKKFREDKNLVTVNTVN